MNIVIHSGLAWNPWSPHCRDIETGARGLGGSQLAAARVAHELASMGNTVHVFGVFTNDALTQPSAFPNKLFFASVDQYNKFLSNSESPIIDLLVVSRYAQFLRFHQNIKKVFLWCHDVAAIGKVPSSNFQNNLSLLGLSPWHVTHLQSVYPNNRVLRTSNGLEAALFESEPLAKVERRFIFSSAIDRGLVVILRLWPQIIAQWPDATLHIYSDLESPFIAKSMPALAEHVKSKVAELSQYGVSSFGFVNQCVLRDAFYEADIWLFPTTFTETYCITALEAQAAGCLCIVSPLAALNTTVSEDRGYFLQNSKDFDDVASYDCAILKCLFSAYSDVDTVKGKRANARAWALQQTWQRVCLQWINSAFE